MPNHGGHILEMRHRFLTATVAIVLTGLVSGQFPFRNGLQPSNYASFGSGPQAPVNYGNLQNYAPYNQASFFSNSGSGIPRTNIQSNAAAGQASDAASSSFFSQINNQPPINNFQYANTFTNPVDTQLPSADYVMSSLESNPLIKQFLPGTTNANPITNGAQLIPNSQKRFAVSYVPGSITSSLENDPLIKQFFPGSTNANPVTNGAQLIQNFQNGFPISYVSGSNPLPNTNPFYTVPVSNAASASFSPQMSNQPPINNLQYANSFANPVGSQLSSADSVMSSLENNPLLKQYLRGPTNANPGTNGAQLIQNYQNVFPTPYLKPRRRYQPPFPIRPNSFPNSNTWSRADNYDSYIMENSPDGNTPTDSPTISTFSFLDDSSNNPTPFDVVTFSTSMTDKPSTSSVLNSANTLLDYSLPSDVPLEYPKSDFPEGFFVDMLKSLGANSKKASTAAAIQPKRRRKCKVPRSRTGKDNSSSSPVAANTDLVSKIPNFSDLAPAAVASSLTTTPQTDISKSVTIIGTKNANQNSDLTTTGLNSVQPKKKKKCNKTRVKPKVENGNSQNDLLRGPTDVFPSFIGKSVKGILNLSNASNNDTNFRSSDKSQKARKCQLKRERMKAANAKGVTAVSLSRPTDVMSADNNKQNGAATDSSEINKVGVKATTVGPGSCGVDEVWWDCKPLNNTCTNVARGKSQKNFICKPGCYCADDLVRDVDGACVDSDDCAAPVCKDEDHEEITDCLIECNRCEDDCHPCQMQSCVQGCDCKDGYKRNDKGTCVLDIHCPPCPTGVISD